MNKRRTCLERTVLRTFNFTLLTLRSLAVIALSLSLGACDKVLPKGGSHNTGDPVDTIKVERIKPDSAYKNYTVDIYIPADSNAILLEPRPWLKLKVKTLFYGKEGDSLTAFRLERIENLATDYINRNDVAMQVVVDLTLNDSLIAEEKELAVRTADLFKGQNMYVSFFDANGLSETYPLTKYVLDTHFKRSPAVYPKKTYRTILAELQRMSDVPDFTYFPNTPRNTQWGNLKEGKRFLLFCSDGQAYGKDNLPMDSEHYELKKELLSASAVYPDIQIFGIHMGDSAAADGFMQQVCANSGGQFSYSYRIRYVVSKTLCLLPPDSCNYRLNLSMPDHTVFRGGNNLLCVELMHGDSLVAKGSRRFTFGSIYHPIVVNGRSVMQIVIWGIIISLVLMLVCYLVMQYALPWILYKRFRKKYVVTYTGPNMVVEGNVVDTTCHYCKAPFEKGETIVAKCEHTLHWDCWAENKYKCTEYGRHCKKGTHYYNAAHKSDPRNSAFYMKWIVAGILSGMLAWVMFMMDDFSNRVPFIEYLMKNVTEGLPTETVEKLINRYDVELYFLPYFGLYVSLFLAFFINLLAGHGGLRLRRVAILVIKTAASGLLGYLAFLLDGALTAVLLADYAVFLAWVPWTLTAFGLVAIASYDTEIRVGKVKHGIIVSVLIGLATELTAQFVMGQHTDIRLFLLLGHILYAVGFCVSIAYHTPRSERFFLRMEGSIKCTDIALYKWFADRSRLTSVTIGHSVNCNLQITWDMKAHVAPEAAKLSFSRDRLYLTALDDGVILHKREVEVGRRIRLNHGTTFTIGSTVFTYLERDV